jgi:hypothetical protein
MMSARTVLSFFAATLACSVLWGCEEESSSETPVATYPAPPDTPSPPMPAPAPAPAPAPEPLPSPEAPEGPSAAYPLDEQNARGLVLGGVTVAGRLPGGLELLVLQTSENVYEQQPVVREFCDEEYDLYSEEYEEDCYDQTVYEDQLVEKTVYVVTGGGYARLSFETLGEAFARAASYGVRSWRSA